MTRLRRGHLGETSVIALDLFAGLGGWDHGARTLGFNPTGIELDDDACRSRALSDLSTIQADVARYDQGRFAGIDGLIASPPCQSFSRAGNRRGLDDPRGQLVYEPLRWAHALRPRWIACEQVPPVEPIWREIAHHLRGIGYRTWVGLLNAEQFGVPQTRQRAILMAHRDRGVLPPPPTHQRFVKGEPAAYVDGGMFGSDLLPWVSVREALGERGGIALGFPRRDDRGDASDGYRERDWRESSEPAFTLTEKGRSTTWILTEVERGNHDRQMNNSVALSLDEGLVLQGFPADLPLHGTKTSKWRQIGNAVPPPVAAAILAELIR